MLEPVSPGKRTFPVLALASCVAFAANGCKDETGWPPPDAPNAGGRLAAGGFSVKPSAGGNSSAGGSSNVPVAGGSSSVSQASGGVGAVAGICSAPGTRTNRHPGAYDYETCNKCHNNWWGGWLYNNSAGDAWVAGATVTVTNADGTKLSAISEEEGFFYFENWKVGSTFTPCVSKCPNTLCATKPHSSSDCQTPACHGGKNRLIYLLQGTPAPNPGGANCKAPASGGCRVHSARDFDSSDRECRICHDSTYTGGYVYDGPTSYTVVSMATVTITPSGGSPVTAVSGPGGMFFLGEVGPPSFRTPLTAPYIACVSKCPTTICSAVHSNTDDCSTCHNDQLRIYLR